MKKTLNGVVTSVGMKDTVVVEVFRKIPHPLYRKLLKRSKKYSVDTDGKSVAVGDEVSISEIKPISKSKYFKIAEIKSVAKEAKHS